jgi:hypothetical protein
VVYSNFFKKIKNKKKRFKLSQKNSNSQNQEKKKKKRPKTGPKKAQQKKRLVGCG